MKDKGQTLKQNERYAFKEFKRTLAISNRSIMKSFNDFAIERKDMK
jgi:hypothetical protein